MVEFDTASFLFSLLATIVIIAIVMTRKFAIYRHTVVSRSLRITVRPANAFRGTFIFFVKFPIICGLIAIRKSGNTES